jgi:hypothetical protein
MAKNESHPATTGETLWNLTVAFGALILLGAGVEAVLD